LGQKRDPLPPFVDVSKKILSGCSKRKAVGDKASPG
jgi:hypothetical protein